MRGRIVLGLVAALAAVPALARHVGMTDERGYPIVVPPVRSLAPASGSFALPAELTVSQGAEFDLAPLEKAYAGEVAGGSVRKVADGALCRFLVSNDSPASKEGYRLVISPKGIRVASRTAAGLYYGAQTLAWMIRNREGGALKACAVDDWPKLPMRGAFLEMNNLKPSQMARQCEALEGLAALKYNVVMCDIADNLPLSISNEFVRETTLSRADVEAFKATAKRCHIQIIPFLQVLSHAYWLTRHRNWNAIKEGDPKDMLWNSGYCPQNPEAQRIVETVVRETCEMFQPKLFNMSLDEQKGCPHQICPKCRNVKWADLVVGHVKPIADMLLARGVRPVVAQDEFTRKSMTRAYPDLEEVPERLGKDTVMCIWQYEDNPTSEQWQDFKERGFKGFYMSYGSPDNVVNLPKLAYKVGAPGVITSWWLKIPSTFDRVCYVYSPRHAANTVLHAVYSWDPELGDYNRLPFDPLVAFRAAFDRAGCVKFLGSRSAVPLGDAVTALVGGGDARFPVLNPSVLGEIRRDAAKDGFRLETDAAAGMLKGVVLSGGRDDAMLPQRADIGFAGTAEGFSFLISAAPFSTYDLGNVQPRIASIRVRYADGGEVVAPLSMYGEVSPWNDAFGGVHARFVSRVNDANGLAASFCAMDWRNPRPDAKIAGIAFESACEKRIVPMLFGVVAYGAKQDSPAVKDSSPKRLVNLAQGGAASFEAIHRFETERDIKRLFMYCDSVRDGKHVAVPMKRTVVDDPVYGKVMEVRVQKSGPPAVNNRLYIEFPIASTQEFKTVRAGIYCDHPEYITRSDMYVRSKVGRAYSADAAISVCYALTPGWNSMTIPRTRFRNKEGGGAKFGNHVGFVVAFYLTPYEDTVFRIAAPGFTMREEACRIDNRAKMN